MCCVVFWLVASRLVDWFGSMITCFRLKALSLFFNPCWSTSQCTSSSRRCYRLHCFVDRCFTWCLWRFNPRPWYDLVMMRLRDALLLPAMHYYLFFFQPMQPCSSFLVSSIRIRIAFDALALLLLSPSILILLSSVFLCYVDMQEGFSFCVACGTKRMQHLFCDHFFYPNHCFEYCYSSRYRPRCFSPNSYLVRLCHCLLSCT